MTEIELMNHIKNFVTIQHDGVIYTYNKSAKVFESKFLGVRKSLDWALSHCKEIKAGWHYEKKEKDFEGVFV